MPELTRSHEPNVDDFIRRWDPSGSAERANYSMFLTELCALLAVPGPQPARPDDRDNAYVFERSVPMDDGDGKTTVGRIDLYKRGSFVIEAKQGSTSEDASVSLFAPQTSGRARRGTAIRGTAHWDAEMKKAKGQAERYVKSLPPAEGNPPFILVVDVGHVIEVYADFSRLGKTYTPFPDVQSYRIPLAGLADEKIRKRLALVWTDPLSLDPARHSAKVTREIAEKLAKLAKSFEAAGHNAEVVASFLMRCLFTFFAEDVFLIERKPDQPNEQPFTDLLKTLRGSLDQFIPMVQEVWSRMDAGGFSTAIRRKLKHFNGKLFKECQALPVNAAQLELLIEAGTSDWSDVEPAIFGTLLERALEPRERHKLGAHYTPRAYVERLVLPTVIEPLREKWDATRAAAFTLQFQGKNLDAQGEIHKFLTELCNITVLDPACGTANFLYVTMEHMKRLEGEAWEELRQLGETQEFLERTGVTVDPHQFLGLEINPRAVAIAELVLWIGYLKWHLRTLGHAPSEPLLKSFNNVKQQDAVLAYDSKEIVTDELGKPVRRWDGHTMKVSPVTGEEIPDETARVPVYRYANPRKAEWPKADYIVGNPPFIGNKRMIATLGEEYTVALRKAHDDVPESADFVMYWWHHAAGLLSTHMVSQFGLITTNSITQSFNRRIVANAVEDGISLRFAVPDHPWADSEDGAAVRIAMTVAGLGSQAGTLRSILQEREMPNGETDVSLDERRGVILADLRVGLATSEAVPLASNSGICGQGMKLVGDGFCIDGDIDIAPVSPTTGMPIIRRYVNPRDVLDGAAGKLVIDFFELTQEQARSLHPAAFQRVLDRVKPLRDQNRRDSIRKLWWRFAWERPVLRRAIVGLTRYFVTLETSKHRFFVAVDPDYLWDGSLFAFAIDDFALSGILNSRIHVLWALAMGGRLEDRPRYQRGPCFESFPFPICTDRQKQRIRLLGESLDAHRKRQQALHPGLTITDMYNVLEKLRKGDELTANDRQIHEQGLVSVLRQIHDDLDAAVADAYGWPALSASKGPVNLSDEEILTRLVALNAERAEEEKRGVIRWLRPEFQNPAGTSASQGTLALTPTAAAKTKKPEKLVWPKSLAEQAHAVRAALAGQSKPATAAEVSRQFKGAKADRIAELLATLAALGQARAVEGERFVA